MSSEQPVGLYLSVPFCKAKCSFCNFASDAFGPQRMDAYVDRLCVEIRGAHAAAEKIGAKLARCADSVYFGGGTPSLLRPEHFRKIFTALREEFDLAVEAEATLECAPGQLGDATLHELLLQTVKRVSLGVQSFVDREAAAVGRLHTGEECEREIARLHVAGVERVCLDLIVGLPHQTEASWRESVRRTIESGVSHVSVYMLEIDEDSRLGREVLGGGTRYGARDVPHEDKAAEWYELGCELFSEAGIGQYEISNFARAGYESHHNRKYWRRHPYVGFGLDAHSMLPTATGGVRFQNTDDLDGYMAEAGPFAVLSSNGRIEAETIGRESAFEESLFLGLRMNAGVEMEELRAEFGDALVEGALPAIGEICDAELLEMEDGHLRLTARGRMASNEVFSRLLVSTPA